MEHCSDVLCWFDHIRLFCIFVLWCLSQLSSCVFKKKSTKLSILLWGFYFVDIFATIFRTRLQSKTCPLVFAGCFSPRWPEGVSSVLGGGSQLHTQYTCTHTRTKPGATAHWCPAAPVNTQLQRVIHPHTQRQLRPERSPPTHTQTHTHMKKVWRNRRKEEVEKR